MRIFLLACFIFLCFSTIIFAQNNSEPIKNTSKMNNSNKKNGDQYSKKAKSKPVKKKATRSISKTSIVILDLVDESTDTSYEYLSTTISEIIKNGLLRKRNYPIVSKDKVQSVISDNNISHKDLKDDDTALKIGKAVKADIVIFGSYSVEDGILTTFFKVANVKNGKIIGEKENKNDIGAGFFTSVDVFIETQNKKIVNLLRIKKKRPVIKEKSEYALHYGIIFPISRITNETDLGVPYISLTWQPSYFKISNHIFLEGELIYFFSESTTDGQLHTLIPIISLVFPLKVNDKYTIIPKLGAGTSFRFSDMDNKSTPLGITKIGIQNDISLTDSFNFIFNIDLFWQFDPDGVITYISPNIRFQYAPKLSTIKMERLFHFGVRGGPYISSDGLNTLYMSIFWRDYLSGERLFYEYEIGLPSFKTNKLDGSETTTIRNIPFTLSLVYQIDLTNWWILNPKVGLGYMLGLTPSSTTESYALLKTGFEFAFRLNDDFFILLDNNLLVSIGGGVSTYYIPTLAISKTFQSSEPKNIIDKKRKQPKWGYRLGLISAATGGFKDTVDPEFPYLSIFFRDNLSDYNLFYELELGYFSFVYINNTSYRTKNYPLTLSVISQYIITDWFIFNPKAGIGYMLASTETSVQSGLSSFLLFKPGLEFLFRATKSNFFLLIEISALVSTQIQDTSTTFYLIPSLGAGYRF